MKNKYYLFFLLLLFGNYNIPKINAASPIKGQYLAAITKKDAKGLKNALKDQMKSGYKVEIIEQIIEQKWEEGLKVLINKGLEWVNVRDSEGRSVLHLIIEQKWEEGLKVLLKKGTNVDVNMLSHGLTPLYFTVEKEWEEGLKLLLDKGIDINAQSTISQTALFPAVQQEWVEGAKLLLNKGIDINAQNSSGQTVSHCVVEKKLLRMLKLLLATTNVDVNLVDQGKKTPLQEALYQKWDEGISFLLHDTRTRVDLQDFQGYTPLHLALTLPDITVSNIRYLIGRNKVLNAQDDKGNTPLSIAVIYGREENVRFLLKCFTKDVGVNAKNSEGNTALHLAAKGKSHKIMQCLLEVWNIKLNLRNKTEQVPLSIVMENKSLECLTLLLAADVDVNKEDNKKRHPLYVAIKDNWLEGFKLLLAHSKISVPSVNNKGEGLLHCLIKNSFFSEDMFNLLLADAKIGLDLIDISGGTALHLAIKTGNRKAVELLVSYGAASKGISGNNGKTLFEMLEAGDFEYAEDREKCRELLQLDQTPAPGSSKTSTLAPEPSKISVSEPSSKTPTPVSNKKGISPVLILAGLILLITLPATWLLYTSSQKRAKKTKRR